MGAGCRQKEWSVREVKEGEGEGEEGRKGERTTLSWQGS